MNISRELTSNIGEDIKSSSTEFLKSQYLAGCNKRFYSLSRGQKHFHREIVSELTIRGFETYMNEADQADHEDMKQTAYNELISELESLQD